MTDLFAIKNATPLSTTDYWKGKAGDDYVERNAPMIAERRALWSRLLLYLQDPRSILEVGANVGQNLMAIEQLAPAATLHAVEPNAKARLELRANVPRAIVSNGVARTIPLFDNQFDVVFTSGVLIHVHPDDLYYSVKEMVRCSKRHVVFIEYFAAEPEMKPYRGESDRLWKRDFGQFAIDNFGLQPIECGFAWKALTGLDNLTWWILRKS